LTDPAIQSLDRSIIGARNGPVAFTAYMSKKAMMSVAVSSKSGPVAVQVFPDALANFLRILEATRRVQFRQSTQMSTVFHCKTIL